MLSVVVVVHLLLDVFFCFKFQLTRHSHYNRGGPTLRTCLKGLAKQGSTDLLLAACLPSASKRYVESQEIRK